MSVPKREVKKVEEFFTLVLEAEVDLLLHTVFDPFIVDRCYHSHMNLVGQALAAFRHPVNQWTWENVPLVEAYVAFANETAE